MTNPFLIGVSGGTASGKTSLSMKIAQETGLKNCTTISQDSFYLGLTKEQIKNVQDYNFDHPNSIDFPLIYDTLEKLTAGNSVQIPIYDFVTHSRLEKTVLIHPTKIIIFQGILAFYDKKINNLMNIKIFVDSDADVRLARRCKIPFTVVKRDIKERGRDIAGVLLQYNRFVKPAYDQFIKPTMRHADIIVPRGPFNTVALNLLLENLSTKLKTKDEKDQELKVEVKKELVQSIHPSVFDLPFKESLNYFHKVVDQEKYEIIQNIITKFIRMEDTGLYSLYISTLSQYLIGLFLEKQLSNRPLLHQLQGSQMNHEKEISEFLIFEPKLLILEEDLEILSEKLPEINCKKYIILTFFTSQIFLTQLYKRKEEMGLKEIEVYSLYITNELQKYAKLICAREVGHSSSPKLKRRLSTSEEKAKRSRQALWESDFNFQFFKQIDAMKL